MLPPLREACDVVHRPAPSPVHRVEVPVRPDRIEQTVGLLWQAGALGLWERPDRLVAWFAEPVDTLPRGATWSTEPDRDWQAEWKATIEPVRAGRITVVPSWLAAEHPPPGPTTDASGDTRITIVLDPGRAFGTGHHATTTLCLELLDALDLDGRTVADIGCGTGILAIAAAMCDARALGVDIDPDAVAVARANARRNGVEVEVAVGSVDALAGRADVVVANLVTDVVVALAPRLVAATTGILIVSGVAAGRRARVVAALTRQDAVIEDVRERDGWIAIQARVPDVGPGATADADGSDRRA